MQKINKNEADAAKRRMYLQCFDATDGLTPETGEVDGQPEMSIDGATSIETDGVLIEVDNAAEDDNHGRYYVQLTQDEVALDHNTVIQGQYKSANTAEAIVVPIQIIDPDTGVNVTQINGASASAEVLTGVLVSLRVPVDGGVIEITQGDLTTFTLQTAEDLTDKKVYFAMSTERDGTPDLFAETEATITQANPGVATIQIDAAASATADKVWGEWKQKESDDSEPVTLAQHQIIIRPKVF